MAEAVAQEVELRSQPERASGRDFLDREVARVGDSGQDAGIGARRRAVARAGCGAAQVLVRPHVVVLDAEVIKRPLLAAEGRAGRADRFAFEGAMHALVRPILLRLPREDALRLDAQPDPPDTQGRESVQACRGEGDAVVGANGTREAVLAEEALELDGDALRLG